MRRVCLTVVANDFVPLLVARLPNTVVVTAKTEAFDKAVSVLRLEGPGLPEWCNEPPFGGEFAKGAAIITGDSVLRLFPAPQDQPEQIKSFYERVLENYRSQN